MHTETSRRIYRTHGVEIDRDAGLIRRNGTEFPLRNKSHRLLLHLIENRNAPVTKEDLIRLIWEGAAVSDDTLVNCVQEIRKALGDDARNPIFIRTMPKTGYWFVAALTGEPAPPEPAIPLPAPPPPSIRRSVKPWLLGIFALALSGFTAWKLAPSATSTNLWDEAAWWSFDDPAADPIPPGITRVPGVSGSALRFSGTETTLSGKATPAMPLGEAPRTIMAWVKTTPHPADTTILFNYGAPNPDTAFDSVLFGIHESGSPGLFSNRSSLLAARRVDDGQWHHLTAVYDGASRRATFFVDGLQSATGSLPSASQRIGPENRWSIGRTIWGSTPFRGELDDLRVFARTLQAPEIQALIRCQMAPPDLDGNRQFVPVFNNNVAILPPAPGEFSARIRNTASDFAGISFARRLPACAIRSTIAADEGQDLTIQADLRTGGNATDQLTEAGPYFRSRRSAPGDGIIGGTSAGYWVQLRSNGQVRVRRLAPYTTIAFTAPDPAFDPSTFHRLTATAKGETLTVTLDGKPLSFDQAGHAGAEVKLAPEWEKLNPKGKNGGAAGIAFGAESNRGGATGQEARAIVIRQ